MLVCKVQLDRSFWLFSVLTSPPWGNDGVGLMLRWYERGVGAKVGVKYTSLWYRRRHHEATAKVNMMLKWCLFVCFTHTSDPPSRGDMRGFIYNEFSIHQYAKLSEHVLILIQRFRFICFIRYEISFFKSLLCFWIVWFFKCLNQNFSNCLFFRWFLIRNLFVICFFRIFWLLFVLFEFMKLLFFHHDHVVVWSLKLLYVW